MKSAQKEIWRYTVVENLKVGHYVFGISAMIGLVMVGVFLCPAQ